MLRLEPRSRQSFAAAWLSPVMALVLTMFTGGVIFLAMGKDPTTALYIYFVEPLTTTSGLSEVAVKAGPLILIGVGLSFGFRAGVWNIGAEGQIMAGAIGATWVARIGEGWPGPVLVPAMPASGVVGGGGVNKNLRVNCGPL